MGHLSMKNFSKAPDLRSRPMKHRLATGLAAVLAAATTLAMPASAEEAVVTDRSISVGAFVDAGQVIKGRMGSMDGSNTKEVENLFLNRDGIALTYSGTVNNKLHMNIGVGGLFWKAVPEGADAGTKRINFGPGISEASGRYDFTDRAKLKFGFFGYKYNPDAVNLGEYLLRSEAYPTVIQTGSMGGWVWMNSNEYKSMGALFSWTSPSGMWRHDAMIFSEFNQAPIFDFSPSYVVTGKPLPILEVGAGISLHRWLPIEPSRTTPRGARNTYVEVDDFPAYGVLDANGDYQAITSSAGTLKEIQNRIDNFYWFNPADSTVTFAATRGTDSQGRTIYVRADTGAALDASDTLRIGKSERLTFQAVKVMGRASLDLGTLLAMPASSGPFKLFTEVAVLGVQNQPYYFEKRSERVPVMAGLSIPTFGVLDLLSFQVEYLKNSYPDNNSAQFNNIVPHAAFPGDSPADYAARKAAGQYEKDDLKWTAYLKKTVVPGLEAYLQVANDHFRVQDFNAQPSFMPLTQRPSDWYYMLRLQWNM
jgi:hypothetical protein